MGTFANPILDTDFARLAWPTRSATSADFGLAVFDYGSSSNGIVSASVAGVLKLMLMRNP